VRADEANSNGSTPEVPSVAANEDQPSEPLSGEAVWDAVDEAPAAVAARLAQRLQAHVVALLLDNGQGLLETAGGVGLAPAERRIQVEYGHDILRELFRVGVGLIDDTDRVAGLLANIPFGHASTLMMVPLIHDGHGFGVLLAGRHRRHPSAPRPEFTELEIEALMDFAEDVAPALRSAVLLRRLKGRLKGQVDLPEGV
jgi:GAF domain-containing protein